MLDYSQLICPWNVTFSALLTAGPIQNVTFDAFPIFGVGTYSAAAMALYAYITLRMAALAGLQVPAGFRGMFAVPHPVLGVAAFHVRLDAHAPFRVTIMAGVAELLVMAPVAGLRVVESLDRVDGHEVAAMALRDVVAAEIADRQVGIDPASLVTVEAE